MALLAARGSFVKDRPAVAARLAEALAEEVERTNTHPVEARKVVNDELGRLLGKRLPPSLLDAAWPFVDFTCDPLPDALETIAGNAAALGLAPACTCRTLFS